MSMTKTGGEARAKTVSVLDRQAHLSEDYARAENERLWGKVWQVACRLEEIPRVGDYVTYDILDESIIVVRVALDRSALWPPPVSNQKRPSFGWERFIPFMKIVIQE